MVGQFVENGNRMMAFDWPPAILSETFQYSHRNGAELCVKDRETMLLSSEVLFSSSKVSNVRQASLDIGFESDTTKAIWFSREPLHE